MQQGAVGFELGLHAGDLCAGREARLLNVRLAGRYVRLVGLQGGKRVIERLLRGGVLFDEGAKALDVEVGFEQIGFRLPQISLGLGKRDLSLCEIEVGLALGYIAPSFGHFRLVRTHVENVEQSAGAHVRTDLKKPLLDEAVDASPHFHHVARESLGGVLTEDGNVFRPYVYDGDHWRRRRRGRRRRVVASQGR